MLCDDTTFKYNPLSCRIKDDIKRSMKTRKPPKGNKMYCAVRSNGGITKAFATLHELVEYIHAEYIHAEYRLSGYITLLPSLWEDHQQAAEAAATAVAGEAELAKAAAEATADKAAAAANAAAATSEADSAAAAAAAAAAATAAAAAAAAAAATAGGAAEEVWFFN